MKKSNSTVKWRIRKGGGGYYAELFTSGNELFATTVKFSYKQGLKEKIECLNKNIGIGNVEVIDETNTVAYDILRTR